MGITMGEIFQVAEPPRGRLRRRQGLRIPVRGACDPDHRRGRLADQSAGDQINIAQIDFDLLGAAMNDLFKLVFEFVRRHLREMEKNSPAIRKMNRRIVAFGNFGAKLVVIYPIYALLVISTFMLIYLYNKPELAGRTKCYFSQVDYDKLTDVTDQRNCESRGLVALKWEVPESETTAEAKGSLLIHNTILDGEDHEVSDWSEIYIPVSRPNPKPEHLYVSFRWSLFDR